MKFIFFSFLLSLSSYILSQPYVRKLERMESKYGIVILNENGKKKLPNSDDLDSFFENKDWISIDKAKRIKVQGNWERKENMKITDSISCFCRIDNIRAKKNNFIIFNGKIIRKKLYVIDITCFSEANIKYPNHIRILSWDHSKIKGAKKIKKGQILKMNLISAFEEDCCISENSGILIYTVRKPEENRICFFLDGVWVVYMDILNYNLYFTSNLHGLFYTSTQENFGDGENRK